MSVLGSGIQEVVPWYVDVSVGILGLAGRARVFLGVKVSDAAFPTQDALVQQVV